MPLHLLMGETTISAVTEEGQSQITESLPEKCSACVSWGVKLVQPQVATGILFSAFQGSGGTLSETVTSECAGRLFFSQVST